MEKVHARKCSVTEITLEVANDFLALHHRQGFVTSTLKIKSFGLYGPDSTLLGVAQFCAPRTRAMARKYSVELLRLAFRSDVRVSGGASKLVSYYRRRYKPADIFTYQDMRGEGSLVYQHCGFTLVSQAKIKRYLVAPGKSLSTANRSEALGLPYAMQYGPDRITGSKLGERYREDGKRKSNFDLFTEDLGWHVEETPGDRVWEWVDPDRTYYVYRITATDSDKYYIGVKGLHFANASVEDCLKDNYYGSGGGNPGNKFNNWKQKHFANLQKEVLFISSRKGVAYEKEKQLVGDKWQTDPLCLNSTAGGRGTPPNELHGSRVANCEIHGEGHFVGIYCRRCLLDAQSSNQRCEVHGEGAHFAGHCRRCLIEKAYTVQECAVHGLTKFLKGTCAKCRAASQVEKLHCPTHGLTAHLRGTCCLCTSSKVFSTRVCPTHGETKFVGDKCSACIHGSSFTMEDCPKHGRVKHKGGSCYTCSKEKVFSVRRCPIHGESKHQGSLCMKCRSSARTALATCPVHGESKFQNGQCSRCIAATSITLETCQHHGESKHQKGKCVKCRHGLSRHKKHVGAVPGCVFC